MTIIHGEDTANSRQFLNTQIDSFKKQGLDIVRLEASSLDVPTLEQNLNSSSLFGADKAVIIFGFFKLTASKNRDKLKQILVKNQDKLIIFYEEKAVNANSLKVFDKAMIRLFKPNPIIFKFLESITPNNQKQIITLLKQLEDSGEASELIFAMLVRQIRMLLVAIDAPEELKTAPWQKQRLISQAKSLGFEKIISLHTKLYEIDKSVKTGKTSLELKQQLFNLLIQI